MKVIEIEKESNGIYSVTVRPNCIGRLFGVKEKVILIKATGSQYSSGGGNVYINRHGEKLGNGHYIGVAIDKWERKF